MKVKELIKELQECNPEADVTIVMGNEDDNILDVNIFEVHSKDVDEYIELFIPTDDFLERVKEEENAKN